MEFTDPDRVRAAIDRDRDLYGTTFTYDGQPLDPAKVVMYRREPEGASTEVEEYDEWRLTGQPPPGTDGREFPPYDFTARSREHLEAIREIAAKSGSRGWEDVKLVHRRLTVTRTEWEPTEG